MGGTALGFEADRYTTQELRLVNADVQFYISDKFPFARMGMVQSFHNKESHGDLDIAIQCSPESWVDIKIALRRLMSEYDFPFNDNKEYFSMQWRLPGNEKRFQVDLIATEDLTAALNYYNYNDLGNLVGRLAHLTGFKFGHEGLKYVVRAPGMNTRKLREIIVSTDLGQIYEFVGLDYSKAKHGFKTLDDVFEFVKSSHYFHPDIYLFENQNAKSRIRDRKRTTYNAFLKYCEGMDTDGMMLFTDSQKEAFRAFKLQEALENFPGFQDEYRDALNEFVEEEFFRSIYNGSLVADVTGLEGKELGLFMEKIRGKINMARELIIAKPTFARELVKQIQEHLDYDI